MVEQRRVVTAAPENSETPLERLASWVTPNRLFFVRNHFEVPRIDVATWRLRIEGLVERPREWTFDELAELPQRTVFATLECAGNGRSFLRPHAHGVPWGAGAIGHAEWTGVPLREVLDEAGLKPSAVALVFEGHDRGTEADHPEPMSFCRGLPMAKALDPHTLIALRMNGELLEPNHGFPARLLVPGWYGVASVKWLRRIAAVDQPPRGYYETIKYTIQERTPQGIVTVPLGPMMVKSEIIRPRPGEVLGVGANRVAGVAWAGEEAVARVEVSADGGRTWADAELVGPRDRFSWTLWEYLWEAAAPGCYTLLARATTASGRVQPLEHDPLHGGYLIHHSRPTPVEVVPARRSRDQLGDAALLLYDMNAFAEENTRLPLDVEMDFTSGEGI